MATRNRLQFIIDAQDGKAAISVNNVAKAIQSAGRQANKASPKTTKLNKSLFNAGKQGNFSADGIRNLAGSLAIVQGPLGPVAGRLNALGAVMGRLNIATFAVTAGITAVGVVLTKTIKVTKDYETQMLALEAAVLNTGGTASMTAKELDEFARELGLATLTSAEEVRKAEAVLLSFRTIGGDTFKEVLKLAQDLAQSGFGDLTSSTKQLAKALEDPITGLTMLKRSGILFTQQSQDMIKSLAKSGELFKAQKLILEEVRRTVGGTGVGAAGGLAGSIDTLGESWTNMLITAGTSGEVLRPVGEIIDVVALAVQELGTELNELDGSNAVLVGGGITRVFALAADSANNMASIIALPFKVLAVEAAGFAALAETLLTGNVAGYKVVLAQMETDLDKLTTLGANSVDKFQRLLDQVQEKNEAARKAREARLAAGRDGGPISPPADTSAEDRRADAAAKRERRKLDRILEANRQFHIKMTIASESAHVSERERERVRHEEKLRVIEERAGLALANMQITFEENNQVIADAHAQEAMEMQLHKDNLTAIEQKAAERSFAIGRKAIADGAKSRKKAQKFREQQEVTAWTTVTNIAALGGKKFQIAVLAVQSTLAVANALSGAMAAWNAGMQMGGIPGAVASELAHWAHASSLLAQLNQVAGGAGAPTAAAGGGTTLAPPPPPEAREEVTPQFVVNILQTGNGTEFVDNVVIPQINERGLNADVSVIDIRSRAAQDIIEAAVAAGA